MQQHRSLMYRLWAIFFLAVVATLLATSCKPTEWATQKQIGKAEFYHPALLYKWCAEKVPVKVDSVTHTEYIKGAVQQLYASVDCDTVRITDTITQSRIVRVPCGQSRVDTVRETRTITKENSAAVMLERENNKKLAKENQQKESSSKTKTAIIIALSAISLLLIILLWIAWRTKLRRQKQIAD